MVIHAKLVYVNCKAFRSSDRIYFSSFCVDQCLSIHALSPFQILNVHFGLETDGVGLYLKFACMQPYLIDQGDMLLLVQMIALLKSGQWKLHIV